jgi:hypothetical protein
LGIAAVVVAGGVVVVAGGVVVVAGGVVVVAGGVVLVAAGVVVAGGVVLGGVVVSFLHPMALITSASVTRATAKTNAVFFNFLPSLLFSD